MNQKFNPVSITTSADDILKITRAALAYTKEIPEYWRAHCDALVTGAHVVFFNYVEVVTGEMPLGSPSPILAKATFPGPIGKPFITLHPDNGITIVMKGDGGNNVFRIAKGLNEAEPIEVWCSSGLTLPMGEVELIKVEDEIQFESLLRYPYRLAQQKKAQAELAKELNPDS